MIKVVFDGSGMSVAEFARQIHLERTTIYSIFRRQSIDSLLLARISITLKHNFLYDIEHYYGLIPKTQSLTIHIDHIAPDIALHLADLLNTT